MTACDAYSSSWISYPGKTTDSAVYLWTIATAPAPTHLLTHDYQNVLRNWWNSLSEHEKLGLTHIPLALLDETSNDWSTLTERQ